MPRPARPFHLLPFLRPFSAFPRFRLFAFFCVAAICAPAHAQTPVQTPVVPNASPQARALLHYLQSQQGLAVLSGQVEDTENVIWHSSRGGDEFPYIHRLTGVDLPAESATRGGSVTATTFPASETDFRGTGYVQFPTSTTTGIGTGVYLRWNVSQAAATSATLVFRYANSSTTSRSLNLVVNGTQIATLGFPGTSSANRYLTVSRAAVQLQAGNNTIDLVASAASIGPVLDQLAIGATAYEAESATLVGGLSVATVNSAFTGTGYVQFPGSSTGASHFVRWSDTLATARRVPLAFRFSNGNTTERSLALRINGTAAGTVTFNPTGGWTSFQTLFTAPVDLPAGPVTIELNASAGTTGPYLDSLQHSGEIPAIRAFDFIWHSRVTYELYNGGVIATQRSPQRAIDWYRAGGIVAWQWHWKVPTTSGGESFGTDYALDITRAFTPGTAEYNRLIGDMDIVAADLKKLRDAGVPVLWRPLHEAAGRWFWWGHIGPDNYKKLWRLMFDRFTYHNGLNNLLWVNNCGDSHEFAEWYPGDDTVDIVSIDKYSNDAVHDIWASNWRTLADFNFPRKVPALSENGPIPDPAQLQAQSVRWSYFCTWSGGFITDGKRNPAANIVSFYRHPFVLNRDALPDWNTYAAPATGPATALALTRPLQPAPLGAPPSLPLTIEPIDAAGRIDRAVTGSVTLRWEGDSTPFATVPLVRGVATVDLLPLQRRHAGRRLLASLAPLADAATTLATVGPGSGTTWQRWNHPGDLRALWNTYSLANKTTFYALFTGTPPTSTGDLTTDGALPSAATSGDNFLVRVSGLFIPTTTGPHRFWVYGDDRSEFYLQTNPASAALTRLAYNTQSQTINQWDEETSVQRSAPQTLIAGTPYRFDFYFTEFTGNGHAALGYTLADTESPRPIPALHFLPPEGYTFARWAAAEGLSGPAATTTADPDGDGRSNFLEFALGQDPSVAQPEANRLLLTTTPAPATRRFALPLPDGDNVALSLQAATDLAAASPWTTLATWSPGPGWTLVAGAPSGLNITTSPRELIDTRALPAVFYRLRAE